jgi:AraC-like DNA-binding protein
MTLNYSFLPTGARAHFNEMCRDLGLPQNSTRLEIPPTLGQGSLEVFTFQHGFEILYHQMNLLEAVNVTRLAVHDNAIFSVLFCRSADPLIHAINAQDYEVGGDSPTGIVFSSTRQAMTFHLPAARPIEFLIVTLTRERLEESLLQAAEDDFLHHLITTDQPFFLFEELTFEMEQILEEIKQYQDSVRLRPMFFKARVTHLLYLFFQKLLSRKSPSFAALDPDDLRRIFVAKQRLLSNLEMPIPICELAAHAGLSESKLKRLFRQVFGNSIYQYHKAARFEEARRLLNSGRYNVSEVGNRLGFTNLSHFSRAFRAYHQIAPSDMVSRAMAALDYSLTALE